jgi:hypothetical protein
MAQVLLLYYHLISEGGFTNDQTVYIDRDNFDGFSFLDSKVIEKDCSLDIDGKLIREGAVIYLLCDLNDMVGEYEEDYLQQNYMMKIINSLSNQQTKTVPEAIDLVTLVSRGEESLDYSEYGKKLEE